MTFNLQAMQALFCAPSLIMKIYSRLKHKESHLYLLHIKVAGSHSTVRTGTDSSSTP